MGNTGIEYATKTWNPIEGCAPCSPGCERCWARRFAHRQANNPMFERSPRVDGSAVVLGDNPYGNICQWDGTLAEFPDRWSEPLKWRTPQRVFVGSRSDIALWPGDAITNVRNVMYACPQHRFLWLTKRPTVLAAKLAGHVPLENCWLGVTVCSQAEADEKIPQLLKIPAAGYWLSVEPMLGPVEWNNRIEAWKSAFGGYDEMLRPTPRISWVVCGGESGEGARPMLPDWVRSLRDQCQAAGVPFWFKQWSDGQVDQPYPADYAAWVDGVALLDGLEYHELFAALRLPGEV